MNSVLSVIPAPARVSIFTGRISITSETRISWAGDGAESVANLLAGYLRPSTGFELPVRKSADDPDAQIVLSADGDDSADDAGFTSERYMIEAENGRICIEADSADGLARAVQTLRQMLPPDVYSADVCPEASWSVPACRIEDIPLCRWRGLHLDVSRHFFPAEDVCRFIELAAQHKYNVIHLHLTDDQGWRVEIKKYPKLTGIGSVRPFTLIGRDWERPRRYDGKPYAGFYTQDQLKAIVKFAADRRITIVPEVDMPGHMQAAVAAYPELGNTSEKISPRCHWGISCHILNPEESTVKFMCDVLDEIMEIFPSKFIHIGGDEANKYEWNESPRVHELMVERGLKNEAEMQSWFIRQLDKHVSSRGRRILGWDEILEGGLADGAAVMCWRGEAGGIAAAKLGHDVVMANNEYVYFDHYQDEPRSEEPPAIGGMSTTAHVYAYHPVPGNDEAIASHILGAQGQLWTEYIADMKYLEYMTYPRACALSEVLWSQENNRNYNGFLTRLAEHRSRLSCQNVNAHPRP